MVCKSLKLYNIKIQTDYAALCSGAPSGWRPMALPVTGLSYAVNRGADEWRAAYD